MGKKGKNPHKKKQNKLVVFDRFPKERVFYFADFFRKADGATPKSAKNIFRKRREGSPPNSTKQLGTLSITTYKISFLQKKNVRIKSLKPGARTLRAFFPLLLWNVMPLRKRRWLNKYLKHLYFILFYISSYSIH